MIGEAAFVTEALGRRVTATALPAIAQRSTGRYSQPCSRRPSYGAGPFRWPLSLTTGPLLGAVDEVAGLVVATGLKSTIVLTPLAGALMADLVSGVSVDPRLAEFSPSRAMNRDGH